MERARNKQRGFSIVEVVLIVAALIGLTAIGWAVYQHGKQSATTTNAEGNTTQSNQQTTTTPAPTVAYLTITEWGIKIPLSDSIKDAYYVVDTTSKDKGGLSNQIYLGLKSLDDSGCTAAGSIHGQNSALAMIFRTQPGDVDFVTNKLYTQEYPDGVTIGSYYYAFQSSNNDNASTCKAPQTTVTSTDSAFASAAKGIVSATAATN